MTDQFQQPIEAINRIRAELAALRAEGCTEAALELAEMEVSLWDLVRRFSDKGQREPGPSETKWRP